MKHTIHLDTNASPPQSVRLGGCDFAFVTRLEPERDAAGAIIEFSPQARYKNAHTVPLNEHGAGTFCQFRVVVPKNLTGVYALVADGAICYIGICVDLAERFGAGGYAQIQPKNCYKGGQSTNCKINRRILAVAKPGGHVALYFHQTAEREALEKRLIRIYAPPWNG